MVPPQLTQEQRQAALEKAAAARRTRAELKERLRTGGLTLAEVFEQAESDQIVAGTKLFAILISLPGFGKIKAKRLMEAEGIADNRRIRGVGERQRARLVEYFC